MAKIKTFTETSTKPYNRHTYKLVFGNGKFVVFEDYEIMRACWWDKCQTGMLSHVEVLQDVKTDPVEA